MDIGCEGVDYIQLDRTGSCEHCNESLIPRKAGTRFWRRNLFRGVGHRLYSIQWQDFYEWWLWKRCS